MTALLNREQAASPSFEKHYTPSELADIWNFSYDKILDMFRDEPGVMVEESRKKGKRRYCTIRIPASVAERVHRRKTKC